ncbi:MAG TPA: DUF1080 domain-containing protein, partial [Aggregatilineales bacterium]|nr:DUF1080 domain-containing protein [Aggregatilineales bacterium]
FMTAPTLPLEALSPIKQNSGVDKTQTPSSRGIWMFLALGLGLILVVVVLGMMSRNAPPSAPISEPTPEFFITNFTDDPFASRIPQDNSAGLTRQITANGYQIINNRTRQAIATLFDTTTPYGDFIIQLTGQLNEGSASASGYGIIFRYYDEDNYNVFAVDGLGRYSIWVRYDGEWEELRDEDEDWTPDDAILPIGQMNTLEIEVSEDTFTGYVNGKEIIEVEDDSLDDGGIGIYVASTSESNTNVIIASYRVMESSSSMTDSMTGVDAMTGADSMTGEEETATPEQ